MNVTLDELTKVKTELEKAEYGGGHPHDASDADILNTVKSSIPLNRMGVSTSEIWNQIDATEHAALSQSEQDYLSTMMQLSSVDFGDSTGADTVVKTNLRAMFPSPGTITGENLAAIFTRDGSRAEELLRPGARLTPSDVANARRV